MLAGHGHLDEQLVRIRANEHVLGLGFALRDLGPVRLGGEAVGEVDVAEQAARRIVLRKLYRFGLV